MKIGLLGFGVVGKGVYDIIRTRTDMSVTKILCLEQIDLEDAQAVHNYLEIVNDPEIDTVVEAIGGLHPAYEMVRAALEAGKNVVSSNKALVCNFYDELLPLAKEMGVSYRSITITSAKTRWGSCSGENALRYTFRLLYCPKEIIDYVVVHELAHTLQHNHSKQFWQVVERYIPDWKTRRKWLKDHGILMEIF
jgi:hypothetical protein